MKLKTTKKNHRKIQPLIFTSLGILCVCFLFLGAIIFPKVYYRFYDSKMLNRITYTNVKSRTFETSYRSFEEKLCALAKAHTQKERLHAVPIHELPFEQDSKKLTEIANQQLKTMKSYHILPKKITLKKKNLTEFERYTIYSDTDMQSFCCWMLVYITPKKKITLYIDEEFHKIYYLCVQNTTQIKSSSNTAIQYIDDISSNMYSEQKAFFTWWHGMLRYYKLNASALSFSTDSKNLYGTIQFGDASYLSICDNWSHNENQSMGIPIKKMIQF